MKSEIYGMEDGKVFRFISDYQRKLWIWQLPGHRNQVSKAHPAVRRVAKWVLLPNDIEEGVIDENPL